MAEETFFTLSGECPVCGQVRAVTRSYSQTRLRPHGSKYARCKGSGQSPVWNTLANVPRTENRRV